MSKKKAVKSRKVVRTEFITISYDSENTNLKSHRLDAKSAGEAMIALAEAIDRSDRLLNPGRRKSIHVFLDVPAQEGSLEMVFGIDYYNMSKAVIDVLPYLGFGFSVKKLTNNLFSAIEETKGETVIGIHTSDDTDEAKLSVNGHKITTNKNVAKLLADKTIRENIQTLVSKPLGSDPGARFKIYAGREKIDPNTNEPIKRQVLLDLSPSDIKTIKKMKINDPAVLTETLNTTIALQTVSFKGKKGWEMIYGNHSYPVEITDESFIKSINENITSFKKGDLFTVTMTKTTKKLGYDQKESYTITKVKRHLADKSRQIVTDTKNGNS